MNFDYGGFGQPQRTDLAEFSQPKQGGSQLGSNNSQPGQSFSEEENTFFEQCYKEASDGDPNRIPARNAAVYLKKFGL
jgi:hypothetical protein